MNLGWGSQRVKDPDVTRALETKFFEGSTKFFVKNKTQVNFICLFDIFTMSLKGTGGSGSKWRSTVVCIGDTLLVWVL